MHRNSLLSVAGAAALLSGCIFAFDTDYADQLGQDVASDAGDTQDSGADVLPDDTGDTAADAPTDANDDAVTNETGVTDALADGDDTTVSPDVSNPDGGDADLDASDADAGDSGPHDGTNGCGGTEVLEWGVSRRGLGESCGDFGEGILVCAGLDALYCLGAAQTNECGTTGVLPDGLLGTACGCGGTWVCADGEGFFGLRCVGGQPTNECGGCDALDGRPGYPSCGYGPGTTACDGPDGLQCTTTRNACGGSRALSLPADTEGDPIPGAACDRGCGTGIVVCDGAEALVCDDGHATNACGGCMRLAFAPGEPCRVGDSVWTCISENELDCPGGAQPNVCGGDIALFAPPGTPCEGGKLVCDRGELNCATAGPALENACGGFAALEDEPGAPCGPCDAGTWVCETPDTLSCYDEGFLNTCGGCTPLPGYEGVACGACSDGEATCSGDDESLDCVDAVETTNECGSCGLVGPTLGTECGGCGTWQCEFGRARCELPEGGCVPLTCATVGPRCDELGRVCNEGAGGAACGACVEGFTDVDGVCVVSGSVVIGVSASNATSEEYVEVTWDEYAGATGYHVYRDGERITATPVTLPLYFDTGADRADPPDAPVVSVVSEVEALRVSWSASIGRAGTAHVYAVTAVVGGPETAFSATDDGYRRGYPAESYEMRIDGGPWNTFDPGATYYDTEAPASQVFPGSVTASDATSDSVVSLTVEGAEGRPGQARTYEVRGVNSTRGPGPVSEPVSGRRLFPGEALTYQWQRSTGIADADFVDLEGATSNAFEDTTAPLSGAPRWYRVVVSSAGALTGVSDADPGRVAVAGAPTAPTGLTASDATSPLFVELVWNPVASAAGYIVFRDGRPITPTPVTETSFRDTDADPPGPCEPPPTVNASRSRVNNVVVSWTAPTCANGTTHSYEVTAVSGGGLQSPPSSSDSGERASLPPTGFEISINDGDWIEASIVSGYIDNDAPPARYFPGAVSASDGDSVLSVTVTLPSAWWQPGDVRRYRVRTLNAAGAGLPSAAAEGWRVLGEVRRFYWQRSAGISNSNYSEIGNTAFNTFEDLLAPASGATRWYRVVVEIEGLGLVTSEPDTGYRFSL